MPGATPRRLAARFPRKEATGLLAQRDPGTGCRCSPNGSTCSASSKRSAPPNGPKVSHGGSPRRAVTGGAVGHVGENLAGRDRTGHPGRISVALARRHQFDDTAGRGAEIRGPRLSTTSDRSTWQRHAQDESDDQRDPESAVLHLFGCHPTHGTAGPRASRRSAGRRCTHSGSAAHGTP